MYILLFTICLRTGDINFFCLLFFCEVHYFGRSWWRIRYDWLPRILWYPRLGHYEHRWTLYGNTCWMGPNWSLCFDICLRLEIQRMWWLVMARFFFVIVVILIRSWLYTLFSLVECSRVHGLLFLCIIRRTLDTHCGRSKVDKCKKSWWTSFTNCYGAQDHQLCLMKARWRYVYLFFWLHYIFINDALAYLVFFLILGYQ